MARYKAIEGELHKVTEPVPNVIIQHNQPEMPDITPAQTVSLLTLIVSQAVDATLISGQTSKLIIGIGGIVIPVAWTLADAIIRRGRAHAHATITAAIIHAKH